MLWVQQKLVEKWPEHADIFQHLHDIHYLRERKTTTPVSIMQWLIVHFPKAAEVLATQHNLLSKEDFCHGNAITYAGTAGNVSLLQKFLQKVPKCTIQDFNILPILYDETVHVVEWWLGYFSHEACETVLRNAFDTESKISWGADLLHSNQVQVLQLLILTLPNLRDHFLQPFVLCFAKSQEVVRLLKPTQLQLDAALMSSFDKSIFISQFVTLVNAGAIMQPVYVKNTNAFIRACCDDIVGFQSVDRFRCIFRRGTKRSLSDEEKRYKDKYKKKYKTHCETWHEEKFFTWPLGPKLRKFIHKGLRPSVYECRNVPRFFLLYAVWGATFSILEHVLQVPFLPTLILEYSGVSFASHEELIQSLIYHSFLNGP